MAGELKFPTDLYAGTAEHYDRFRPPYPLELLDELRARVPLHGTSRLLDLACGTGQIVFALSTDVGEVGAVDQEPEAVALGQRKAARFGVTNVRWAVGAAEDVSLEGAFDLVTVGNAFHRLDRPAVAARLVAHLPEGGCVALLWSDSPWQGDRRWQRTMGDVLDRWQDATGAGGRVPAWEEAMARVPHERVLRNAGLTYEGKVELTVAQRWSVESLIGFTYSTSFLNLRILGAQADAFERDLRDQLLGCSPDGVFTQDQNVAYELARRTP